ncbi:MAG: PAS domain S-box protein [Alphaproteobacteria bacterium]|nr:PAS domain S-box protein [Alphaproteobacteria bacterium]
MDIKTGFFNLLILGAALLAATILAFGFSQYAFFEDTSYSERLDKISNEGMQLVQLTNEVLLYGEPRALDQWQQQYRDVGLLIEDNSLSSRAELVEILGPLRIRYANLLPLHEKLTQSRDRNADSQLVDIIASQLYQDSSQLQASLRSLKAAADDSLKSAYETVKHRQVIIFSLFTGLVSVYGVFVSLLFRRTILAPLYDLRQTIHSLRDGKAAKAPVHEDDEIGAVCVTFNHLLDEQETVRNQVQLISERFRNIFEQAAVGMSIVSPNGDWLEVNQCLCDILGYERSDFLATNYQAFTLPENLQTDILRVKTILSGELAFDSWETRYRRKDGRPIWARITTTLARDGADSPLYFVTVTEDITERKEADARLLEINRQLEEQATELKRTNADLESFAWVASHDLREPLRMVSSYVGLIKKRLGPELDEDMAQYISYAIEGSKRMDALILGLLDYARIGRRGGTFESVSLADVAQESLLNLSVAIQEEGACVTLLDGLPKVIGDRSELVRLFQNLIGNAIKFHRPDRAPEVSVAFEDKGSEWVLRFSDNGIGIDPDYYEKVFRIFQRLVRKDQYAGTGIGLSICRKIVEHHGGRIWVLSEPGEGSTFFVAFPK